MLTSTERLCNHKSTILQHIILNVKGGSNWLWSTGLQCGFPPPPPFFLSNKNRCLFLHRQQKQFKSEYLVINGKVHLTGCGLSR